MKNDVPSEAALLSLIANAERQGFTHSAAALRDIYARHYTQPRRQAVKESHDPWGIHPATDCEISPSRQTP